MALNSEVVDWLLLGYEFSRASRNQSSETTRQSNLGSDLGLFRGRRKYSSGSPLWKTWLCQAESTQFARFYNLRMMVVK